MSKSPAVRILVADDEEAVRNLLKTTLQTQDFEVELAADGQAAVDSFQAQIPNAILMDINMPRLDGIQAIRKIRSMPGGVDVPIIVLTALDVEEWEAKVRKAGATIFLTKPFRPKDVIHCLRTVIEEPQSAFRKSTDKGTKTVADLKVRYKTAQGFLNCFVKNLMDGRSFIHTDKILPLGSTFNIEITPPDQQKPFHIQAEVRWINLYPENKGMGIQFSFTDPADEKRIQDLVNELGTYQPG